jgi:hypothetical protein
MAQLTRYLVTGSEPEGEFAIAKQYVGEVSPARLL